jgi:chemotaxis protein methyltransferase CheR
MRSIAVLKGTSHTEIHPENYRFLREYVYAEVGLVLEEDKHYLVESRLAPIVRELGLESVNDLCALLKATRQSDVSRQVVEAMTTNETYFFRDPAQYEAIRTVLLPQLRDSRRHTKRLRFWSAAASTGQEAYSLAMVLLEEGMAHWNIEILGTDYCSRVLEQARSATYRQIEVNRGLPAGLLVKYFRRQGLNWQLNDEVRRLVRFEQLDLRRSMRGMGPFELVFCRNVLIYFDSETKLRILKEIHGTLARGGWLLLGGAEMASGLEEWYERHTVGAATIYVAR